MKEKKRLNIFTITLISIIITTIIVLLTFIIINICTQISPKTTLKNVVTKRHNNKDYYIIKGDFSEECDIKYINLGKYFNTEYDIKNEFERQKVMDYIEYQDYCKKWNIEQKYADTTKHYIVFSYLSYGSTKIDARLATIEYINTTANLYVWDDTYGVATDISGYCIIIPTENNLNKVNTIPLYTDEEFNNIKKYNVPYNPKELTVDKPIIYLYPEIETEVSVKLGLPDNITCSYPKYKNDGWKVLADPNGNLVDLSTNRKLYSLYYESTQKNNFKVEDTGFVVKDTDIIPFLEEKLETLGLNEKESEEFIIYWLPKLQTNKYNYIRFATSDEINENMPLNIEPTPSTTIRILMTYKGLDTPIDVIEQNLTTPNRQGFVAVEWGGTQIK